MLAVKSFPDFLRLSFAMKQEWAPPTFFFWLRRVAWAMKRTDDSCSTAVGEVLSEFLSTLHIRPHSSRRIWLWPQNKTRFEDHGSGPIDRFRPRLMSLAVMTETVNLFSHDETWAYSTCWWSRASGSPDIALKLIQMGSHQFRSTHNG